MELRRLPSVLPLLPLGAAAALAVWSLGFGLPYLFRPDEDVMVGRSVHIALAHSLDPLFYNYPPLCFYLFAAAAAAAQLVPGQHLGPATQVDPTAAYLAARAVSALAFVAGVAFVYATARAAWGRAAGLLASGCLALAPLAVRQAHFATTDGVATALVAATIWAGQRSVRAWADRERREIWCPGAPDGGPAPSTGPRAFGECVREERRGRAAFPRGPRGIADSVGWVWGAWAPEIRRALSAQAPGRRAFLAAGVLAGLAAAAKYTAGVVAVCLLVMVLRGEDRPGRLLAAAAGGLLAFAGVMALAGHPGQYLQGFAFLGGRAGQQYAGLPLGIVYHPTVSLPYGLGLGTYALALAGVVLALARRTPLDVALLAFVLVYLAVIGLSHEDFFRYVLPLLPPLCLLAGGLVRLVPAGGPARRLCLAAGTLLLLPSAYASISGDRLLGAEDTRQQAAEWLLRSAPAGSELRIASYWGQPFYDRQELEDRPLHPLYISGDPVADSFELGRFTDRFVVDRPGSPCFTVAESGPPWQAPVPGTAARPAVVFRPYSGPGPAGAVYDRIDSFYLPIWGFDGLERPGPAIAIVAGC